MTDLKNLDPKGSRDESRQSPRLAAMQRRREKRVVKEDETSQSKEKDLEKLAAEAEKERESKDRKMVEVSEAPARWLEIREALHKEKELRLELKRRAEMEEMNNPRGCAPPAPKRRKRGGAKARLSGSSSSGSNSRSSQSQLQLFNFHYPTPPPPPPPPQALLQPLQSIQPTTLDQLFLQPTPKISQVTWPQDHSPTTLHLFPEAPPPEPPRTEAARGRSSCASGAVVAVTRIKGEILTGSLKKFHYVHEPVIRCDCHNKMFSPEGFLNHAGWTLLWGDDPLKYINMMN